MTAELVKKLRIARSSPAVLKVTLSGIRSKDEVVPIFVFEGTEDVGPYNVWITRCYPNIKYEPLPARGKRQVLEFRERLKHDRVGLRVGVYFFVDRDFDDLQGHEAGPDLFCTERYSIENYFVSASVLDEILKDEFRCAGEMNGRHNVLQLFHRVLSEFLEIITAVNWRIFVARRLGIAITNKVETISCYVAIDLNSVRACYDETTLLKLITLNREPQAHEVALHEAEFKNLEPLERFRGKFLLAFFLKWLCALADGRKRGEPELFDAADGVPIKFSTTVLSHRSLATRSEFPEGLDHFLACLGRAESAENDTVRLSKRQ